MSEFWTPEQEAYLLRHPVDFDGFNARWPVDRNRWRQKRNRLVGPQQGLYKRDDQVPGLGEVYWDKKESTVHWRDFIAPSEMMRDLAHRASASQDFAAIGIDTDKRVPVAFISDCHIGSYGMSMSDLANITDTLVRYGIRVAILGDMTEMAIRLRSVAEVGGNLFVPGSQHQILESWFRDIAALTLWSCWDNHSVQREEDLTGYSRYAEIFKDRVVYFPGIGHVDLTVGGETYRIATSHRFRGNTQQNPTGGQEKYMRTEGIDRELAVAGDSHRPAIKVYADGPLPRLAVNCGTLQTDSKYAKRYFSLYTHDWMPVVVFDSDTHRMTPFPSLQHYIAICG